MFTTQILKLFGKPAATEYSITTVTANNLLVIASIFHSIRLCLQRYLDAYVCRTSSTLCWTRCSLNSSPRVSALISWCNLWQFLVKFDLFIHHSTYTHPIIVKLRGHTYWFTYWSNQQHLYKCLGTSQYLNPKKLSN